MCNLLEQNFRKNTFKPTFKVIYYQRLKVCNIMTILYRESQCQPEGMQCLISLFVCNLITILNRESQQQPESMQYLISLFVHELTDDSIIHLKKTQVFGSRIDKKDGVMSASSNDYNVRTGVSFRKELNLMYLPKFSNGDVVTVWLGKTCKRVTLLSSIFIAYGDPDPL